MRKQLIAASLGAFTAFGAATAALSAEKSYMMDVGGISAALMKGQEIIGELEGIRPPPGFLAKNESQRELIKVSAEYARELVAHLTGEEFTVIASADENQINAILQKAGSRIRIKFEPDDKFAVISILNVGIKFEKPADIASKDDKTGKVTYFNIDGKPAMRFTLGAHAIQMKQMKGKREPVIALTAKNGDLLVLHRTDDRHMGVANKEQFAKQLLDCVMECDDASHYLGAIVPLTLVDTDVDIGWMKGLGFAGTDWYVSQAKQQVRFYLDPNGATVKTETVVVFANRSGGSRPSYYRLDGAYYAVMYRPGMTVPYFSGWVSSSDFNVPPTYTLPKEWTVGSAE